LQLACDVHGLLKAIILRELQVVRTGGAHEYGENYLLLGGAAAAGAAIRERCSAAHEEPETRRARAQFCRRQLFGKNETMCYNLSIGRI
jgi:hypothetical protein